VDLLDLLILVLRIALVVLLYLFLVTVLRQAAGGLRLEAGVQPASPKAAEALRLMVIEAGAADLSAGQVFEIAAEGATLGRARGADIVVTDPAVSAEHARLSRVGQAWVVTDLGSTNGTRLNETRVEGRSALADGDVLALGNVRLQVLAR
jgi:pSer/pThr/pTyr-binding forkhead associated (FHA) protein